MYYNSRFISVLMRVCLIEKKKKMDSMQRNNERKSRDMKEYAFFR